MLKVVTVAINGWWGALWLAIAFASADLVLAPVLSPWIGRGLAGSYLAVGSVSAWLLATLGAPFVWLAVGALPALSFRVYAPPILMLIWMLVGASPLTVLGLGAWWLGPALLGVQLAVLAWTTRAALQWQGGVLLPQARLSARPHLSWRRLGAFAVAHLLLAPPAAALYTVGSFDLAVRYHSGGYVTLGLDGVQVAHRQLVRGDQRVDLIGMIHVGDEAAYPQLFATIPVVNSVVLEEGVSDAQGALGETSGYSRMASALGVSQQRPVDELTSIRTRNADVDVARFSDRTRELLGKVLAIHGGDEPLAATMAYMRFVNAQPDQEAMLRQLYEDIVVLRNANLIDAIERSLADGYRPVVPWGALHLPEVERHLLDGGFRVAEQRRVTLIAYPWAR